jgi:hypothetical protein
LKNAELKGGVLSAVSSDKDPAFGFPPLKIRASEYSKVIVEMRVSRTGDAQLFWTTSDSTNWTEPASMRTNTKADGDFHEYEFKTGKHDY